MNLETLQERQVRLQKKAHKHKSYTTDIKITEGVTLKNFKVSEKVLRPEKMSSIFLARWLFFNNGLYRDKTVIDMGCGSGIQGLVCGLNGAKEVVFTDISSAAYNNTLDNVKRFGLQHKSKIYLGSLFEKVKGEADLIIFNHPFFHDNNFEEHLKDSSTSDRGNLIQEFFHKAKGHMKPGSMIIMPYFHLAGPINNPEIQAKKHAYLIKEAFNFRSTTGLQKGDVSIYVITLK